MIILKIWLQNIIKIDFLLLLNLWVFLIIKMDPKFQDYIDDILNKEPKCNIFGGYVYKCLVRGECDDINDLDVQCGNVQLKCDSKRLLRKCTECDVSDEPMFNSVTLDCKCTDMPTNRVQIDIVPYIRGRRNFTNCLMLTDKGIKDIHNDNDALNFAIDNLKKGRYCKWRGMRSKDKEYFKDFEEINPNECESYGFLYDYPSRETNDITFF